MRKPQSSQSVPSVHVWVPELPVPPSVHVPSFAEPHVSVQRPGGDGGGGDGEVHAMQPKQSATFAQMYVQL